MGPYLRAGSQLVRPARQLGPPQNRCEPPAWAAQLHTLVPAELIADVQVWRTAEGQLDLLCGLRLWHRRQRGASPQVALQPVLPVSSVCGWVYSPRLWSTTGNLAGMPGSPQIVEKLQSRGVSPLNVVDHDRSPTELRVLHPVERFDNFHTTCCCPSWELR